MMSLISSRFGINQSSTSNSPDALFNGTNSSTPSFRSPFATHGLGAPLGLRASNNGATKLSWLGSGSTSTGTRTLTSDVNGCSTSSTTGHHLKHSHRIRIQTCSLDICRGDLVDVDQDVYESMWDVLDEVFVGVCDEITCPFGTGTAELDWKGVKVKDLRQVEQLEVGCWKIYLKDAGGASSSPPPGLTTAPPNPQEAPLEPNNVPTEPEPDSTPRNQNSTPRSRRNKKNKANQADSSTSVASSATAKTLDQNKQPTTTSTPPGKGSSECGSQSRGDAAPRGITQPHAPSSHLSTQPHNQVDTQGQGEVQNTAGPKEDESTRFPIFVMGPERGQRLELLVRGRHIVGMALAKACEDFGVDPDMTKIFLLIKEHGIGGGRAIRQIECDKRKTMNEAGVKDRSRLAVVLISADESEMTQSEAVEEFVDGDGDEEVEESYRKTEEDAESATVAEIEGSEESRRAARGEK
ncbi:hypothetical protein AX16_004306 [Volvariella volvacea WC 439]|nr:hypothetical protein AX16_004306 [Volvariella volvacea WC 439]